MSLSLYSEPYAPTGNLGDSGIRKLLGAPALDLLQTLVRESVQNSCDAAKSGNGLRLKLRLRTLTPSEMQCLTEQVFAQRPSDEAAMTGELQLLPEPGDDPIQVLEICDFGTTGLAGPVRADRIPPGTQYTDFIDFLRNIGTARNTDSGGGTYGFGKIALYLASGCSTIVVDSLSTFCGEPVRRAMACRLGPAHDVEDAEGVITRHTGRHWWGVSDGGDPVVDPLEGEAAARLSAKLGMPVRNADDTGTTIMIIGPRLGEATAGDVALRVADQLLWQFWPRMTRDVPEHLRINAVVEHEGKPLALPAPEQYPPLNLYATALAKVRARSPDTQVITGARGKRLGTCATVAGLVSSRHRMSLDVDQERGANNHAIALMRPVGMVVKYLPGAPLTNPSGEWAGVFVSDEEHEVESAFAQAEPPAHDDWQPGILPSGKSRRFVQVALRKVKEIAAAMGGPVSTAPAAASDSPRSAAAVASALGTLMTGDAARNPEPRRGPKKSGRPKVRARTGKPVFSRIGLDQQTPFAEFTVDIQTGRTPGILVIRPGIVIDGALDRDQTSGEAVAVHRVSDADGNAFARIAAEDYSYQIPAGKRGNLSIRTNLPSSMAIGVEVTLRLDEANE